MTNAMRNMTRSIETGLGFEGTVDALRKALGEEHLQVLAELPFEERLEEVAASGGRNIGFLLFGAQWMHRTPYLASAKPACSCPSILL